ncbi:hypothetical protein B0H11DRAFT_1938660 [Mycena galericulata]|nr:hypothetical protein B0H11DRAFT_1938660 [Mycena galericulata]
MFVFGRLVVQVVDHAKIKFSGTLIHRSARRDLRSVTIGAFAHFVFGYSKQELVFADLQGTACQLKTRNGFGKDGLVLFDLMTHTLDGDSGVGDFGIEGIKTFTKDHECNEICRGLALHESYPLVINLQDDAGDGNEKDGSDEEEFDAPEELLQVHGAFSVSLGDKKRALRYLYKLPHYTLQESASTSSKPMMQLSAECARGRRQYSSATVPSGTDSGARCVLCQLLPDCVDPAHENGLRTGCGSLKASTGNSINTVSAVVGVVEVTVIITNTVLMKSNSVSPAAAAMVARRSEKPSRSCRRTASRSDDDTQDGPVECVDIEDVFKCCGRGERRGGGDGGGES